MNNNRVNPEKLPKMIVLLHCLLQRSLNTFEANSIYGDSCLHTTISDLKRKYRFQFEKNPEVVKCGGGRKVRCMRYALSHQDLVKAKLLVQPYEGGELKQFKNLNRR